MEYIYFIYNNAASLHSTAPRVCVLGWFAFDFLENKQVRN